MLVLFRHRIGEAALEADQFRPVYPQVSDHATLMHPPLFVDDLRASDQHLLGVATAQGARAAKWLFVNDRDTAACMANTHCRHHRGCARADRSEEHTSELQSLMRISYAVFCLKKKTKNKKQ